MNASTIAGVIQVKRNKNNNIMKPFLITVAAVVIGYLLAVQIQKQISAARTTTP